MFIKSLSANALKYISLLTNFSFHATQKGLNEISRQGSTLRSRLLDMTHVVKHNLINARTKIKRKKVLYQNLQNLFLFVVRVDLLPRSAKGGFKGCGENPNSPLFFFAIEKEHHSPLINPQNFVIQKNCNHVNQPQEWDSNNQHNDC